MKIHAVGDITRHGCDEVDDLPAASYLVKLERLDAAVVELATAGVSEAARALRSFPTSGVAT